MSSPSPLQRRSLRAGRTPTAAVESEERRANVFGPAHRTDTPLVSAGSQAEHRELGDAAAPGEAEIEGKISQPRERVRRVARRESGLCARV